MAFFSSPAYRFYGYDLTSRQADAVAVKKIVLRRIASVYRLDEGGGGEAPIGGKIA